LIAPDETTFEYLRNRQFSPKAEKFEEAVANWKELYSDPDAVFDKEYHFNGSDIEPMITYGTNPGTGIKINGVIPQSLSSENDNRELQKSLAYMDLQAGSKMQDRKVDYVFIGSCTNSRIEDLRLVAQMVKGRKKADGITAWIVPGSKQVREQAKKEGLDLILEEAGFELREAGCSACLGMNEDKIPKGAYCVSTSNRNFEGRQGPGSRTFLASPLTAAATALNGKITDPREYL
jgi:3-isopropylmalate/(R)-2-methylmalate dehydratase large subunit